MDTVNKERENAAREERAKLADELNKLTTLRKDKDALEVISVKPRPITSIYVRL